MSRIRLFCQEYPCLSRILKKYNETVTLDEARLIIEFMGMLANIEIEKIMNYEDSGSLCEGQHR